MLVQWANIYLSLVSGSIVTLVVGLVTNPLYLLEQLADLMPEAAVYFIELIIMKIFVSFALRAVADLALVSDRGCGAVVPG